MPRRSRRSLESNYLHVICQGINRQFIFNQKEHLDKYYSLMQMKKEKFDIEILAYCIMNNHAHMLIYSEKVDNISCYMRALNTAYAHYYNKIEDRVGYVFRDRFLSEPITTERQLYNCIAYIHFNPVKANIVLKAQDYEYSSYNSYKTKTGFVNNKVIKLVFGSMNKYMDMFNFIHYGVGEAMEPVEEKTKINIVNLINCDYRNEFEIKEKSLELKKYNISNRKIAEILKVSRNKINKIMKENEKCQ